MWHNHFYHLYTVPFNLLRSFKDGVHRSNLFYIILVSDTHACHRFRVQKVCQLLFAYVYVAHAAFCVYVWDGNGLHLRFGKTFQCRQHSADDCLRLFVHGTCCLRGSKIREHERFSWSKTRTHERFRWSQTRRPLLSHLFLCCKTPPNY